MIRGKALVPGGGISKPRASGDDPSQAQSQAHIQK
mgnify:CR=1 FL=1